MFLFSMELVKIISLCCTSIVFISVRNVGCIPVGVRNAADDNNAAESFGSAQIQGFRAASNVVSDANYLKKRSELLLAEQQKRVGGEIVLSRNEERVNAKLLDLKRKEIDAAHYYGNGSLGPQTNFLKSKNLYEQSEVFQLIRRMPKGGVLHVHDCSMLSIEKLVSDITYRPDCYMCYDRTGATSFKFFNNPPLNPDCPWKKVSDLRQQSGNVTAFDNTLVESMLLLPSDVDTDLNTIWRKFESILTRANGLINYAPVFRDYFYMALEEFFGDNVQYVEVRALLPEVYNLDGTVLDASEVMQLYINATESFKHNNPDFSGARIIKTNLRFRPSVEILDDIKLSVQLMQTYPAHFAGYDLVGQEDPLKPLIEYLDTLLWPSQQIPPIDLPYFFHAGETVWEGTAVDDNLLDAVLLNTTRIGHGYALTKHPQVLDIVKNKKIAVEINPISNQVLKLVDNIQNHPGASMLADGGVPVVISSDDNSVWGAIGLSYDFYAAFMAMTGEDDGLQVLKQIAMNSLIYSTMDDTSKAAALKTWEHNWDKFIVQEIFIEQYRTVVG